MTNVQVKNTKTVDQTYLELVNSLLNTLVNRLIRFYKQQTEDELLFKEQLQQIQDSLLYYEQFKPPSIKYSLLLQPLSNHLRINIFKQYIPNAIINQVPEKQCDTLVSQKTQVARKKYYSSRNNQQTQNISKLIGSTSSSGDMRSDYNKIYLSHSRIRGRSYQSCNQRKSTAQSRMRQKSVINHNYQKQINRSYNKIIQSVVTSQSFKKRKYKCKIQSLVRLSKDSSNIQ